MYDRASIYKEKSIAISTLWWFFSMGGGKGILGFLLWCSGLIPTAFTFIMGICGPYIVSDLFISSMVIGKFLV